MAVHLPPFDPSREFKALRFFRYNGEIIERHAPFDTSGIAGRKVKQLYENRFIGYADEDRDFPPAREKADGENAGEINAKAATSVESAAGVNAEDGPSEADQIKSLVNAHTKDELLQKASGLKGVRKDMTKAQIAKALFDAGRAGDGTA